jgi:hypothetical protein
VPLLRELALVEEVRVVGDAVDLVREPERELLVEDQVVRVVADALAADQVDARVDQAPALLGAPATWS